MKSVRTACIEAQSFIIDCLQLDPGEAKFEAQLLLQTVLNVNRAWLLTHEHDALQPNIHAAFQALLNRRLAGEPIAYILGKREFYGLELKVTPDTLIPRPDTETLVETALTKIPADKPFSILDLGTGTGAIALAIAKHRPMAQVTAADASEKALDVAKENSQILKISNVRFITSDWFGAINDEKFDVIASNPPYIEQDDIHLSQGDLRFEPLSALVSGRDGLDDIRRIIQSAPQHLKPQGWLMLEHGYNQDEMVAVIMQESGFGNISHVQDLAGITRVTLGMSGLDTGS